MAAATAKLFAAVSPFRLDLSRRRLICTCRVHFGKKNFRKFQTFNKRGTAAFKREHKDNPLHDLGVRRPGTFVDGKFQIVPEMVPEIVVPNLDGFELKPYVSYRVPDVVQSEFTSQDLFDACYADKILQDFRGKKLDGHGNPLEPSDQERLSKEEAQLRELQTGSDRF